MPGTRTSFEDHDCGFAQAVPGLVFAVGVLLPVAAAGDISLSFDPLDGLIVQMPEKQI